MSRSNGGTFILGLVVAGALGLAWTHWHRDVNRAPVQPIVPPHIVSANPIKLSPEALAPLGDPSRYDPDEKLPSDALVVRAQPSVFELLIMGQATRNVPKTISFDAAKVEADYAAADAAGKLRAGESKPVACWRMLAMKPGQYLTASPERVTSQFTGVYASGTAFAISREGIFLTNAHMAPDRETTLNPAFAINDTVELFVPCFRDAEKALGPCPGQFVAPVIGWIAGQCRLAGGKFDHLELVLDYSVEPGDTATALLLALSSAKAGPEGQDERDKAMLRYLPRPITRRCHVLAKGQEMPGKDVAVIKIDMGLDSALEVGGLIDNNGKLLPQPPNSETAQDRFICLPLGDSDAVLSGMAVQAMGFPGSGFNEAMMDPSAAYRVSAENGQISNSKHLRDPSKPNDAGYDAFEMTAEINHGDSGGPVIDNKGQVIAINMGAAHDEDPRGHTLSVPINVARDLLKTAGVTPDPGPLTQKWVEGVRLFFNGKYSAAASFLDAVRQMQSAGNPHDAKNAQPRATGRVNPYVEDLHRRAALLAAKHPDKG